MTVRTADEAWRDLEAALAASLARFLEDEYLIIRVRGRNHYVQFVACGADGMRVEAVSNAYICVPSHRLGDVEHARLAALGWEGPEEVAPSRVPNLGGTTQRNFYLDLAAPVDFAAVARQACRTLKEVYRAPHPSELRYEAFHRGTGRILFPALGVPRSS